MRVTLPSPLITHPDAPQPIYLPSATRTDATIVVTIVIFLRRNRHFSTATVGTLADRISPNNEITKRKKKKKKTVVIYRVIRRIANVFHSVPVTAEPRHPVREREMIDNTLR